MRIYAVVFTGARRRNRRLNWMDTITRTHHGGIHTRTPFLCIPGSLITHNNNSVTNWINGWMKTHSYHFWPPVLGGIDAVYLRRFGRDLQQRLQQRIQSERDGELVVGDALVVKTHGQPQYCISSPTMRVPLDVRGSCNAYLCFRAVLISVRRHNREVSARGGRDAQLIATVLCPGLATGIGLLPPRTCAFQMVMAYRQQVLRRKGCFESAIIDHAELVKARWNSDPDPHR